MYFYSFYFLGKYHIPLGATEMFYSNENLVWWPGTIVILATLCAPSSLHGLHIFRPLNSIQTNGGHSTFGHRDTLWTLYSISLISVSYKHRHTDPPQWGRTAVCVDRWRSSPLQHYVVTLAHLFITLSLSHNYWLQAVCQKTIFISLATWRSWGERLPFQA